MRDTKGNCSATRFYRRFKVAWSEVDYLLINARSKIPLPTYDKFSKIYAERIGALKLPLRSGESSGFFNVSVEPGAECYKTWKYYEAHCNRIN